MQNCLKHLQAQTLRPERILVMDNGSVDDSAHLEQQGTNVVVRELGQNLGFAAANNLALAECDSEFVALLNPDAFPEADWLERLVFQAKLSPEVAAFGSRQLCAANPAILDGVGDSYHVTGLVWRKRHGSEQCPDDLRPQEIFSPCAAAALYRRQAVLSVGGFDEDFFCYVEDVDLGFRLKLAGYRAMYVPNAVVHHVGSATTGGRHSDFSVYHGHRNLVWAFVKDMPGVLFWALLPLHLIFNLVSVVHFSLRWQGKVILRAKLDAVKGLPRMWRKRRFIQKHRDTSIKGIWQALDKCIMPGKRPVSR